jgi:multiple sugar transport system substrate-binding protein
MALAGCGERSTPKDSAAPAAFPGVTLKLSAEKACSYADALRLRLPDFEARYQCKVELTEAEAADSGADLALTGGVGFAKLEKRISLADNLAAEPLLEFVEFPFAYRTAFGARDREPAAFPFTTERLALWYRADLFADPKLAAAYKSETGKPLAPPTTWADYSAIAAFFVKQKACKHGCAEAADGSRDGLRNLFARAAGNALEPRSILLDAETARPKLANPEFARALADWQAALAHSPAAGKGTLSDRDARQAFAAGDAAMLISILPPFVELAMKPARTIADGAAVADLPSGAEVYDAKAKKWTPRKPDARFTHFGGAGQFLSISANTPHREACLALLRFLGDPKNTAYIVQGARLGLTPLRTELLNDSSRFSSYGLTPRTTGRYFELVASGIRSPDWTTDLRIKSEAEFRRTLWASLEPALAGKAPAADALASAQKEWEKLATAGGRELLNEYRLSLQFTALR